VNAAFAQYPSGFQVAKDGTAVSIEEYANLPLSTRTISTYPPPMDFTGQLGRVNFLRSEPANAPLSASRFFVNDLNRNFYILDKAARTFTTYINFEEVFRKFDNNPGFAGGLVSFAFDPEYATNGIFYSVHTEEPGKPGSPVPTNSSLPGFDVTGYAVTTAVNPPNGATPRQAILVEWRDTNINNTTFEGTARELLRVGFNDNIHPMGDLLFNPLAQPGDEDYRNLYIANGDGASGENVSTHPTPQRLDALQGKILRITPDLNLRTNTTSLSANGRYRIPTSGSDPNPFSSLSLTNVKKEIYAYGFRNPHRISWDPVSNILFANDIGLHSWEEVNIIHAGTNYGYAEREGIEQLFVSSNATTNGKTGGQLGVPFPTNTDFLVVTGLVSSVPPRYPAATYSHNDGDAISSGFVYRGSLMPALRGKYVFGDITTGRLFYCNLEELIAADDTNRTSVATIHELQVVFKGVKRRAFDVIADKYDEKGGSNGSALPGCSSDLVTFGNDPDGVPYGCGRADIRLGLGGDGELYLLSKSDGMIRRLTGVLIPPTIETAQLTNGVFTLTWPSISNVTYRVEYNSSLVTTNWTGVPGDVTATGTNASKTDPADTTNRFYRLKTL